MAATSVASGSRAAGLSCVCQQPRQGSNKNAHNIPFLSRNLVAERFSIRTTNNARSQRRWTEIRTIGQFEHGHVSRSRRGGVRASAGLGSDNGPTNDGNVTEFFNEDGFKKQLEDAGDKLVVVDISTKTCGPCKMIYPKVVEMSEEFTDAVFLKIQGDHDSGTRALMRDWGIRSVPCFRFYRKGELIHSHTGAKIDKLLDEFNKHYTSVKA